MENNFNDNVTKEIKERIDIVDYIGRYLTLKRAGKNFQAICPFHKEKTPSFSISPDLQMYKCFGCGESGDIFTFLMKYEHIDFVEALEKLAKETGVELKKSSFADRTKSIPIKIFTMINNLATEFYQNELYEKANSHALEYLTKRGFSQESIKKFKLGYAPKSSNSLLNFLLKKASFSKKQLLECGLFTEKYNSLRDKFSDRIIFPIINYKGVIIGFTARIVRKDDIRPKYLNSPETLLFHKQESVYGIYQARQEIRKEDLCILCEGSTDVISSHQAGFSNIVAPLGTALTDGQIDLLKKYTKNFLVIFDTDEAGQKALERAFLMFSKKSLNCFANNTGEYKDLDELIRTEQKKLRSLIKNKTDAFTYLISKKLENYNPANYEHYRNLLNYTSLLLQSVSDKQILAFYIKKASALTGIEEDVISAKLSNTPGGIKESVITSKNMVTEPDTNSIVSRKITPFSLEDFFFAYIIQNNKSDFLINNRIKSKFFSSDNQKILLDALKKARKINKIPEIAEYVERLLLPNPSNQVQISSMTEQELTTIYKRIKTAYYKNALTREKQLLAIEESKSKQDETRISEIIKNITRITKRLQDQ